jgi:hypothetical protein
MVLFMAIVTATKWQDGEGCVTTLLVGPKSDFFQLYSLMASETITFARRGLFPNVPQSARNRQAFRMLGSMSRAGGSGTAIGH